MGSSGRGRAPEGRGIGRPGGNVLIDRSGVALDLQVETRSPTRVMHIDRRVSLRGRPACVSSLRGLDGSSQRALARFGFSGSLADLLSAQAPGFR
jgi:hypothetical protein